MRNIKFRAWDKKQKWMDDFSDMFIRTNEDIYEEAGIKYDTPNLEVERVNTGRYEIMQYTGLKDKNGKEIYEGDIITTDLERYYLIVEYRNGAFMLNCNDGEEDYYDIFFGTSEEPKKVYKYGEVIGNIYENPELLKEVTE